MFERILIICTGNICRSPMAEAVLRQQLQLAGHSASVQSAGTAALVNFPADELACDLMRAKGLDITGHRACQVTSEHTRRAELILVMEHHHRECLMSLNHSARGKTFLLGQWSNQEIPDPYQQGKEVYNQVLAMINSAIKDWIDKIIPR